MRFKAVDRSWLCLISSRQFAQEHFNRRRMAFPFNRKYGVIQLANKHSNNQSLVLRTLTQIPGKEEEEEKPDFQLVDLQIQNGFGIGYQVFGSCDGLVLIGIGIIPKTFILLNPSTREHKKIPSHNEFSSINYIAGLGYHRCSDNFKVVVVTFDFPIAVLQVYNLRENCWKMRKYPQFPYKLCCNKFAEAGTTLDSGNPYWVVKRQLVHGGEIDAVLWFDVGNEEFYEEQLGNDFPKSTDNKLLVSAFAGQYLCVGFALRWQLIAKIPKKTSISELPFIGLPMMPREDFLPSGIIYNDLMPMGYVNEDELVMSIDKKALALYNFRKQTPCKIVLLSGFKHGCRVTSYVESLISPNNYYADSHGSLPADHSVAKSMFLLQDDDGDIADYDEIDAAFDLGLLNVRAECIPCLVDVYRVHHRKFWEDHLKFQCVEFKSNCLNFLGGILIYWTNNNWRTIHDNDNWRTVDEDMSKPLICALKCFKSSGFDMRFLLDVLEKVERIADLNLDLYGLADIEK